MSNSERTGYIYIINYSSSALNHVNFSLAYALESFPVMNTFAEMTYCLFKEFLPNPGYGRESFKTFKTARSFIQISNLDIYNVDSGFQAADIFGVDKNQVFELFQDRILMPKGYERKGLQYHHYFTKAEWSCNPMYAGAHGSPRCLLGLLTSNLQLVIYGHNNFRFGNAKGLFRLRVNITELYNKILLSNWTEDSPFNFEEYKERLNELAIVAFCWIPLWDEVEYEYNDSPIYESGLISCHANGDLIVWKIVCSPAEDVYSADILLKHNIMKGEIMRTLKYQRCSSDLAILVVGTNSGIIKLFRLLRQVPMILDSVDTASPSYNASFEYIIDEGIDIWENDLMQIDIISITETVDVDTKKAPEADGTVLGNAKRFDVLALKHPTYLISFTAWVTPHHNIVLEINHISIPHSPIVGLAYQSDGNFILCHELGATSIVSMKAGAVTFFGESHAKFVVQSNLTNKEKQRYNSFYYYGLDISPNRAMLCVCRHLGNFYDYKMKTPGKVEFYSLLPHDDPVATWQVVKDIYGKCNSLSKIPDALQVLRYEFKRFDRQNHEWYKNKESLKEMSYHDIQFYLWGLRAFYRIDDLRVKKLSEIGDERLDFFLNNSIDLLSHIREVQDRLVEINCVNLVKLIKEKPDDAIYELNDMNTKSLTNIYDYLEKKGHKELLQAAVPIAVPALSDCLVCSAPVKYRKNEKDVTSGEILESGLLWDELVCSNFHSTTTICTLSLVPCEDNTPRVCPYCRVTCLVEPSFGQKPVCLFCGTKMYLTTAECLGEEHEEASEDNDPDGSTFEKIDLYMQELGEGSGGSAVSGSDEEENELDDED